MEFSILSRNDFISQTWSGGSTRQLFIFPPGADYASRKFLFRLSSSIIEAERSEFTLLPGIQRQLMLLSGELRLEHEGGAGTVLEKFDTDRFDGGQRTLSYGRCTDFNLMTAAGVQGSLGAKRIAASETFVFILPENTDWFFLYMLTGEAVLEWPDGKPVLKEGDLLCLGQAGIASLEITGVKDSELVAARISFTGPEQKREG